MVTAFISVNVLASSESGDLDLESIYYKIGELNNKYTAGAEKTTIAVIAGEPYAIENCENKIEENMLIGNAKTEEEAVRYLVLQEVLQREAGSQGIVVDDKTMDAFIEEQKELFTGEDAKEEKAVLDKFIQGLGLTEEQYRKAYYEEYRAQLTVCELQGQVFDEFFYEKVVERLEELGMELTDEEINEVFEKEKGFYNEEIYKEFQEYYQSYEKKLLEKYDVQFIENIE